MGKKITNFFELDAWREAHKLVLAVYAITNKFPSKETYVITAQMLRAAISITSNIAEGFGRQGLKEKIQFYSMSRASLTELQNQLIICRDLGYLTKKKYDEVWGQSVSVHKLINGLIRSIRNLT